MQVRERLAKRAAKAGIRLSDSVIRGLESYFELLRKWNARVALTALPVAEVGDEAIDRLLVEPALAAQYLPEGPCMVMDVGSGGGSPAIPMKIVNPTNSLLMVESKTRKAAFLREVVRHLELKDTMVESSRFEELLARPELHDSVDVLTLRAVKVASKTLAMLQSFLKPGGSLFLFTSSSGGDLASTPQLSQKRAHPLLAQLGSRLEILKKTV